MVHNSQPSAYIVTEIGTFCKGGNADEAAQADQKAFPPTAALSGDLFAQPPAAFYRLPEFELRGQQPADPRLPPGAGIQAPKRYALTWQLYSNILWRGAANRTLTGKSLVLTGKIRRIDFANKWGEEP